MNRLWGAWSGIQRHSSRTEFGQRRTSCQDGTSRTQQLLPETCGHWGTLHRQTSRHQQCLHSTFQPHSSCKRPVPWETTYHVGTGCMMGLYLQRTCLPGKACSRSLPWRRTSRRRKTCTACTHRCPCLRRAPHWVPNALGGMPGTCPVQELRPCQKHSSCKPDWQLGRNTSALGIGSTSPSLRECTFLCRSPRRSREHPSWCDCAFQRGMPYRRPLLARSGICHLRSSRIRCCRCQKSTCRVHSSSSP